MYKKKKRKKRGEEKKTCRTQKTAAAAADDDAVHFLFDGNHSPPGGSDRRFLSKSARAVLVRRAPDDGEPVRAITCRPAVVFPRIPVRIIITRAHASHNIL